MQRALMQFKNPENYSIVREALVKAHREDLIGSDKKSLIPSRPTKAKTHPKYQGKKNSKFRTPNTESGHISEPAPRTFTKSSSKVASKPNLRTGPKHSTKRTSTLSPRKRQG